MSGGKHTKHTNFQHQQCLYLGHEWQKTASHTYYRCARPGCQAAVRWDKHQGTWVKVKRGQSVKQVLTQQQTVM